jgi:acyl-CoA synthetase (AMP-forming)/AMP-acid ligase II
VALTDRDRSVTFGELATGVRALAAAYEQMALVPGDRIVCSTSNRPEWALALGGAWTSGAVHVGCEHGSTAAELSEAIARTGARALVYEPLAGAADPLAVVRDVRRSHPALRVAVAGLDEAPDDCYRLLDLGQYGYPGHALPVGPAEPGDPAVVTVAAGASVGSEPTVVSHGELARRVGALAERLGFGPSDVHLTHLPLSHGPGLALALAALMVGGRLVLLPRFSPGEALWTVERERVTVLNGAPAHFRLLLDRLEREPSDVSSVRLAVGTTAAFTGPLVRSIGERVGAAFAYDGDGEAEGDGEVDGASDRGGLGVDPLEVETALLGCRAVADGTALTMPDGSGGVLVCACVVATGEQPQPRLAEVRETLGRQLEPYKLPEEMRYLRHIPRTDAGRVDLGALLRAIDGTPHLVERR